MGINLGLQVVGVSRPGVSRRVQGYHMRRRSATVWAHFNKPQITQTQDAWQVMQGAIRASDPALDARSHL